MRTLRSLENRRIGGRSGGKQSPAHRVAEREFKPPTEDFRTRNDTRGTTIDGHIKWVQRNIATLRSPEAADERFVGSIPNRKVRPLHVCPQEDSILQELLELLVSDLLGDHLQDKKVSVIVVVL